ncbi:hypothetical protein [Pelotomaculum propionicicum]|uniref:hypothetical protein n=1 Tax=Pelotomaculum propionicicum TaxID=258475 RepID=UPI001065E4B0|nr:hypothetical protein [Pelotomaculum propionicicum]NLI14189.1 hypothetical protein [Peptococcaceae bacterium]
MLKSELVKWRWLAIGVTLMGVIMIAVPQIPGNYKIALAIPIYAAIVFVNYKYICLKKAPPQEGKPAAGVTGPKPAAKGAPVKQTSQPGQGRRKKAR